MIGGKDDFFPIAYCKPKNYPKYGQVMKNFYLSVQFTFVGYLDYRNSKIMRTQTLRVPVVKFNITI
jgi:hypothetical protein